MTKMSGAMALVESLKRECVSVVFGYPGGFNMPIYDALYDDSSITVSRSAAKQIRHILVRHEQSAVHMADGYARVSGRVGVCMATSGPGATNLITGLATAYHDSSPVVAITGQVPSYAVGSDAFQEADIIGMTASITKYGFQPLSVKEIPSNVKAAIRLATSHPPRPVIIDVPRNVQQEEDDVDLSVDPDIPRRDTPPSTLDERATSTQAVNIKENEAFKDVARHLASLLPSDAIVTSDVHLTQVEFKQTFICSTGFATRGFGFPAALGAKIAKPEVPVLTIEDRDGFLMTENSLATSFEEQIPIIVVILNKTITTKTIEQNRFAIQSDKRAQLGDYSPDIVKLAQSYEVQSVHVNGVSELETAVKSAIRSQITTVIDASINL